MDLKRIKITGSSIQKKLELLKNIPVWNISDEKKDERKKIQIFILRVEYLFFTNDNYLFEVPLLREAEWWSAQIRKLNLDRKADIMFNC